MSRTFCVRLTDVEFAWLAERAAGVGLSRSVFARRVLGGVTLGEHVPGSVETTAGRQVWRCGGGAKHDLIVVPVDRPMPEECPVCGLWGTLEDLGPGTVG